MGHLNGEVRQVMGYKNDRMEWRDSLEPVLGSGMEMMGWCQLSSWTGMKV